MKLDRISAVVHMRPALSQAGERLPRPGESLLLTYNDSQGGDLLATTSNGLALRLAGLSRWQRELQPGDTLRVRVLASDPVLELEVEGKPVSSAASDGEAADSGTSGMTRHAAMRLDQAVLRQMAWQAPNAAALALSWRDLAQGRWSGRMPTSDATGEPSAALPTTMLGPAPFREPASTLPPPMTDRWLFPVYAWGGMQMMLGLVQREEESPRRRPGRGGILVLRLELSPVALGRIVLHAHWQPGGVELQIAVEQAESVQLVREALPAITAALARAGLKLARLRLTQGHAAVAKVRDVPQTYGSSGQILSLTLFRTLAETAVVLLQVVPGQPGLSRVNR